MSTGIFNESLAKNIAKDLLSIDAIKIQPENPFTWTSGWKSPIYCDNRLSLSFPTVRDNIANAFVDLIKTKYNGATVIAGVATAGIPQGAIIAHIMGLPFVYIRSSAKSHGMQNQIEGKISSADKVVVVEDLISTGGSSIAAVNALKETGAEILALVSIFTYGFEKSYEAFKANNIEYSTLSSYIFLLETLKESNKLTEEQFIHLNKWRQNPESWGI